MGDRRLLRAASLALRLAMAAVASTPAWAEETAEETPENETLSPAAVIDLIPGPLSKSGVRVHAEETITLLADFGPADATELRTTLGARAPVPVSESFALRVSAVGNASFFDFHGDRGGLAAELGGGALFDELFDAQLGLGGAYRLPCEGSLFGSKAVWSLFGEGRGKLSWEKGAPLSDALKGSGTLGVGLELGERLELALGLAVGNSLDGGVSVDPVVGFRWKIRDDMRLESDGLGLLFELDLLPELELQLRGAYKSDIYRLDDRGTPLDRNSLGAPTLRQREAPVLVALRWKPTRNWRVTGGAGSVLYQHWRIESEQGGATSSVSAGPAALAWIRIDYRF